VIEKSYAVNPRLRAPPFPGGFTRNFGPAFGRQLVPPRRSALLAERLGDLVLTRIARVFLDLARQNLDDADRVRFDIRRDAPVR
jgi:hypothetical protein